MKHSLARSGVGRTIAAAALTGVALVAAPAAAQAAAGPSAPTTIIVPPPPCPKSLDGCGPVVKPPKPPYCAPWVDVCIGPIPWPTPIPPIVDPIPPNPDK